MSELRADTITASDGTSPVTLTGQTAAKAWVNFNGTGTPAIRQSGNISSITDNSTGTFTANFASSLTDADYSVVATGDFTLGTDGLPFLAVNSDGTSGSKTTSNFCITSFVPTFSLSDIQGLFISVFR